MRQHRRELAEEALRVEAEIVDRRRAMITVGAGGAEEVYEMPVSAEEKEKIVAAAKSTAELWASV